MIAVVEEEALTAERVAALALRGFSAADRLRLRFAFEASSLRQAVELGAELRTLARTAVRIRPGLPLPRGPGRWTITLTTPPTRVAHGPIRRWEDVLRAVARGRPGCRLVGWRPVLDYADADRVLGAEPPPT